MKEALRGAPPTRTMKLDFSVLDAPVRAADVLEAEWCVTRVGRSPLRCECP